jgi:hypothetical protein
VSVEVKYIGMDVHKEAIAIAVMNEEDVMESIIETKGWLLFPRCIVELPHLAANSW